MNNENSNILLITLQVLHVSSNSGTSLQRHLTTKSYGLFGPFFQHQFISYYINQPCHAQKVALYPDSSIFYECIS